MTQIEKEEEEEGIEKNEEVKEGRKKGMMQGIKLNDLKD